MDDGYAGLDATRHPALCRLYADWQDRRRGRAFPTCKDFDPLAMKYILGNLSLVEVRRQPLRFYFRIHASNVASRLGFDLTGKNLDDYPDAKHREMIHEHFSRVVAEGVPVLGQREAEITDKLVLHCEAIALPLAKDGESIDMLMSGFVWT
jgi:hypothetical protein